MTGLGNIVIIFLIASVSFILLVNFTSSYFTFAGVTYQNQEFQNISTSASQLQNQTQNLTARLSSIMNQNSTSTSPTDNPFSALTISVYSVIPLLFNFFALIPSYALALAALLPFSVPSIVTTTIILVLLFVAVLLLIDWTRGGIQALLR